MSSSASLFSLPSIEYSSLLTTMTPMAFIGARTSVSSRRKPSLFTFPHVKQSLDASILDNKDIDSTLIDEEQFSLVKEKSLRSTLNVGTLSDNTPLSRPLIVGHRGCLYEELENTRPGFIKTAAMGADAIELDVFLLKCGTVVVFHGSGSDENPGLLNGYCVGREESILNYTYDELQDIVVFNEHYPEFGCHSDKIRSGVIPTLEQVLLDVKDTSMIVKIELKGADTAEPVLTLVESLGMQHRCHYSSFDLRQIGMIRALRPEKDEYGNHVYKTGALFSGVNDDDYLERALEVGASEVHLRYDECTSTRVHEIHAAGMDSMAWFRGPVGMSTDVNQRFWDVGNEDYAMYQVVMQTGVRQMCVNRPDVMVKIFDKTKP